MTLRILGSVILGLLLSTSANAEVRFERKVKEDASYSSTVTSQIDQKLIIAGMDTNTNVETRATSKATVGKRDGLGMLRIKENVESLQVNMNAQGMQYTFDSANPDAKGDTALEFLRGIHKLVSSSATTIVYDKDNRVHAVEIDQNLLASLPAEAQAIVKSQLDPEQLKANANQELEKLPSQPVNVGDKWVRTETSNFGAGQVMTFQTEFTYRGTVEKDGRKVEKITSNILSVMFTLQDSPLPFKLKGSDLKAAESEGTLLFDREYGYTVESTSTARITGDITFTLNDMDLPSKLDLKLKTATTVGK